MTMIFKVKEILDLFYPIGLEEMDSVRFMNRIDTKYIFSARRLPELLKMMDGVYRVLEINGYRISSYSTTYFDTPDYQFFNQHVTGKSERYKVRYRKYDSTGITFLEVKKKTKKSRTIKWRIENDLSDNTCDDLAIKFIMKHIPDDTKVLAPVLTNCFKRITLVCLNIPERITLDFDLLYSGTNGNNTEIPFIAIAELKSESVAIRSPFSNLVKQLSIYPTGFSKYCLGDAILYDLPRKNILKPKLLLINKIENEYNGSFNT